MTDTKKEQERTELHRTIWAIADELRGSVDGWDFKSYIRGILFYRHISESIAGYINRGECESGNAGFDYAELQRQLENSDRSGAYHNYKIIITTIHKLSIIVQRKGHEMFQK